jgi:hypothetical protein
MSDGAAHKTACKSCHHVGVPAFDNKCEVCAAPVPQEGNGMTKEELQALLPLPGEEIAVDEPVAVAESEAGVTAEDAIPEVEAEDPYCGFCGVTVSEEDETCLRCALPLGEQEQEDDKEKEGDDEEGKEGDDAEGDDAEGEEDEKKLLLDKSRRKVESFKQPETMSALEEATFYVDLARQLDETQIKDLAAHVAWGPEGSLAAKPPRWLPEQFRVDWSKLVGAGQPKTMMGAITALRGVIGSREAS